MARTTKTDTQTQVPQDKVATETTVETKSGDKMSFGVYNLSKNDWNDSKTFDTSDAGHESLAGLQKTTSNSPNEKAYLGENGDLLTVRRKS